MVNVQFSLYFLTYIPSNRHEDTNLIKFYKLMTNAPCDRYSVTGIITGRSDKSRTAMFGKTVLHEGKQSFEEN